VTPVDQGLGAHAVKAVNGGLLVLLYVFLYAPIFYIIYASLSSNAVWPFPLDFTTDAYIELTLSSEYQQALWNSLVLAFWSAALATLFATMGGIAILKYPSRQRALVALIYVSPLFIAELLIGMSSLIFNKLILGLPGNIGSAILANAAHGTAFGFLIILAQLARYDWRLDDVAMVFGATPMRCFLEVTLPNIWPAMLGAFLMAFLISFNDLEISFYNLGAIPTLPTIAWGSLRYGLKPELLAMASLVNGLVFVVFAILYLLMRTGLVRFGYRGR
jgi:ABC-type spermidine/putrescine transport system permease subunit II